MTNKIGASVTTGGLLRLETPAGPAFAVPLGLGRSDVREWHIHYPTHSDRYNGNHREVIVKMTEEIGREYGEPAK